ncbi:RNA helicase [Martiniozyma asiatica (nom. inval.)]|nr:RNA helicase [Martiniozyma asiatica]
MDHSGATASTKDNDGSTTNGRRKQTKSLPSQDGERGKKTVEKLDGETESTQKSASKPKSGKKPPALTKNSSNSKNKSRPTKTGNKSKTEAKTNTDTNAEAKTGTNKNTTTKQKPTRSKDDKGSAALDNKENNRVGKKAASNSKSNSSSKSSNSKKVSKVAKEQGNSTVKKNSAKNDNRNLKNGTNTQKKQDNKPTGPTLPTPEFASSANSIPLGKKSKPNSSTLSLPLSNSNKSNQNLADAVSDEPFYSKVEKLKLLIKNTTPVKPQLTFDSFEEYFQYFSYNLFLEELFESDLCTDVSLEWLEPGETAQPQINSTPNRGRGRGKGRGRGRGGRKGRGINRTNEKSETATPDLESDGESDDEDLEKIRLTAPTSKLFDLYVSEEMRHLKKHPFAPDQPIFIIRKKDSNLDFATRPEFWVTYVSNRSLLEKKKGKMKTKFTKHAVANKNKQTSNIELTAFAWNASSLPITENGDNFAILPGSAVMGRIMNAMKRLDNDFFMKMLMGKIPIKKVKFDNKLSYVSNSLNDSQKDAIQTALNNRATILKGPPGSGKTSTIYEIIMQLLDQFHSFPILVVAASNLAVDNIAEKLMKHHKDNILRITSVTKESEYPPSHPLGSVCLHNIVNSSLSYEMQQIARDMKYNRKNVKAHQFSKYMDENMRIGAKVVHQARVILSTTVGISGPVLKTIKSMPVIIMDEATQSSEPASIIPLSAPDCKRIIFVGDEAQLSAFTRVKPLELSLFERVLTNGSYSEPNMLDTQYRMHPAISEFPRKQFYGGKLKDGVTEEQRKLSSLKYPVFFFDHGGVGAQESREFGRTGEEFGFSWANKKEVSYVERIVESLIVDKKINREDIGIMTGYSAQRELITKALERNLVVNPSLNKTVTTIDKEDLGKEKNATTNIVNGIIISTVDAFQGREKNVVIMSCVRANPRGEVGFLKDYRRMNVAFTRAKYSFIMIGDANTLKQGDQMWRDYIGDLEGKGYLSKDLNTY